MEVLSLIREPLFSLVVLVRGSRHCLASTLEACKDQKMAAGTGFEILLLDGEGSGRLSDWIPRYPGLSIQIQGALGRNLGEMMNDGLHLARGKYVQFLEPGERYISQHGLADLSELIQKNGEPQLIYSGLLLRSLDQGPHAVGFSLDLDLLRSGTISQSTWFLKETLVENGGFDARFSHRPSFDMICRLLLKKEMRTLCSKQVLTDCETRPTTSWEMMGYARETCKILHRYFGIWDALKWVFVQDRFQLFRWMLQCIKRSFWQD